MSKLFIFATFLYLAANIFVVVSIFGRIARTTKHTKLEVWVQYYVEAVALIVGGVVMLAAPLDLSERIVIALALSVLSSALNMCLSAPRWKDGAPRGTTEPGMFDSQPMERAP